MLLGIRLLILAEFNGPDTSLVTPEPVLECSECLSDDSSIPKSSEVAESLPGTLKQIDYQEQIQNTNLHFEMNGTSPNSLLCRLQLSLTASRQHGWNSTSPLDLGDDGHDCLDTELERVSKTPLPFLIPPSPPPSSPPWLETVSRVQV